MVKIIGSGRFGTALHTIMPKAKVLSSRDPLLEALDDDIVFWAIPSNTIVEVLQKSSLHPKSLHIFCSKGLLPWGEHPLEFLNGRRDRAVKGIFMSGPSITLERIPWGALRFTDHFPTDAYEELEDFQKHICPIKVVSARQLIAAAVLKNFAAFLTGYVHGDSGSNFASLVVTKFITLFQALGFPEDVLPDLLLTCYHLDSNNHRAGYYLGARTTDALPSIESSELQCETLFSLEGAKIRWSGQLFNIISAIFSGERPRIPSLLKAISISENTIS